jgi:hypothetical protein
MPNRDDWIPVQILLFVALCMKWKEGLENVANITAFGWLQTEIDKVLPKIIAFLTAQAAYEENNSSRNRLAKDDARDEAKRAMREFANTSIRYNPLMTPADRLVYGIRPADTSSTPVGEPESYPEAAADTSIIRQVTINYWDSVTKKRRKPHGIYGAEIRWAILDHQPTLKEELVNSDFDTASPHTLQFDENQRGQRLYFALRWESTSNKKGPFSEFYSVVIP